MAGNDVEIVVRVRDLATASLARIGTAATLLGRVGHGAGAALGSLLKPMAAIAAASSAVQTVSGLAGALATMAPIALAMPGALLAGAAAMATFKIATAGLGDALSATDPKAFAEATKDMPPAMRDAASAMRDVKTQFAGVKSLVQQDFWKGLADPIRDLGSKYLPVLSKRLPEISQQFNLMGRGVHEAFSSRDAVSDFDSVLRGTADALKGMGPALGAFGTGLLKLGAFGVQQLWGMGEAVDGLAQKFAIFVSEGVESGSFQKAFDKARQQFVDLKHIVVDAGAIIGAIFSGLGANFASPLDHIQELTAELRTFFESAAAQGPLQALGETLTTVGGVVGDILVAGLRAVAPLVEKLAPLFSTLAEVVGKILVTAFDQLGPPLTRLIDRLVPILQPALESIGFILETVVIPALAAFIDWLAGPGLDGILEFAQQIGMAFTDGLLTALNFASGVLGAMGSVFNVLSYLPGSAGQAFGNAARSVESAKGSVDNFRGTMEQVRSKQVELLATTRGEADLRRMRDLVNSIAGRSFSASVIIPGRPVGGSVQARAAGGPVSGGLTLVGERGAELVRLPAGSSVRNAGDTARALAAPTPSGGGGGGGLQVSFGGNTDGAFASAFMMLVRTGVIQLSAAR